MKPSHLCEIYLQELYQVLTMHNQRKISFYFWNGQGGGRWGRGNNQFEMFWSIILFFFKKKTFPQEKLFYQILTYLGKGNILASYSHLVPSKTYGSGGLKRCEVHSPKTYRLTKILGYNHRTVECYPFSHNLPLL